MIKTFDITKENRLYIYGGGELGRSFYRQLKKDGFCVKGIIDKNADKLKTEDGFHIISVKGYKSCFIDDDVIIVCVHNALWHTEIVESLKIIGINNILFIPLNKDYSRLGSNEMLKAYNHFVNREYNQLKGIPTLSSLQNHSITPSKAVIKETNDSVVCWVDITSLYTSESVGYATKRNAPKELEEYVDTPMPGMKPYVNLFKLLAGQDGGESDSFLRLCKRFQNSIDEYSDEEFIADRFDLYNELSIQLNFGIERLIESAPDCKWNSKGFFNLLDGMSRTTFLYSRGFQFVPVKIKRNEFNNWVNEAAVESVTTTLPPMTNWEIEHPGFIEYPVRYPGVKFKLMTAIEEYYNKEKWEGKTIIDDTDTDGCIARYFARQGAHVARAVNEEEYEFEGKLINLFCFCDSISLSKKEERRDSANVICLSVDVTGVNEAKQIIINNNQASIICIFHNMNEDAIMSFEEGLCLTQQYRKLCVGRDSFELRIY